MEQHPVEAGETEGDKLFFGGLPRGLDCCLNPQSFFGQLLVSITFETENELLLSGSGKREVRVRVDKPREAHQAFSIYTDAVFF